MLAKQAKLSAPQGAPLTRRYCLSEVAAGDGASLATQKAFFCYFFAASGKKVEEKMGYIWFLAEFFIL